MSVAQFFTDRVVPVLTVLTLGACVYFSVLLGTKGSVGGCLSVAALAAGFGVMVWHDVNRLILKK